VSGAGWGGENGPCSKFLWGGGGVVGGGRGRGGKIKGGDGVCVLVVWVVWPPRKNKQLNHLAQVREKAYAIGEKE